MRLYEYEGKNLFEKYGIPTPRRVVLNSPRGKITFKPPYVLKAQTLFGGRKEAGGILPASTLFSARKKIQKLCNMKVHNENIRKVLVEERIAAISEYYVSFSYDTSTRSPVIAVSAQGGTGISRAKVVPLDFTFDSCLFLFRRALSQAKFPSSDILKVAGIVKNLWKLFISEYAILAEINPLFKTKGGAFVAGDAKIILDDEKVAPGKRRFIELGGDIAILASGGGASLLNIDALIFHGGRPANYTEYSGNPPAHIVEDLTKQVLRRKGLKGCWVVGGTANFTDIYETMRGFVNGLGYVRPKPTYPIVIRRDGPRQEQAVAMLRQVAKEQGYQFHIFGSEISMAETAKIMVDLAYK
ncbi:hypothetical protein MYX07_00145 [Patescibacteria group bacterium AH-259-L07]|nr:hypothetical protein [Patescibacteria group bacterium AH-259-L07]